MLAIGLLAGVAAIAVVPPFITYDGPAHYLRTVQIAEKHFRPTVYSYRQVGGEVPQRYSRFVNKLWGSYWNDRQLLNLSAWAAIAQQQPGDSDKVREEFTNVAVYSPANYLPQCLGLGVSRFFSRSPLWANRGACAGNLLLFLTLIVVALETMPGFQTSLLLIATSPLLFIQASSVSADAINFTIPICMFALVWKLRNNRLAPQPWALAALTILAFWTALLKPTQVVCIGLLCFVPTAAFGSSWRRAVWVAGTIAASGAFWFLWNRPYLNVHIAAWFEPSRPALDAQKELLLRSPQYFFEAFGRFLGRDLWPQWKALYGNVGGWVPPPIMAVLSALSYVFLLALSCESGRNSSRDLRWAVICFLHAAALLLFMAVTLWVTWSVGPNDYIRLGGRYLFLVVTLAFATCSCLAGGSFGIGRKYFLFAGLAANVAGLALILGVTAAQTLR